MNYNNKNIYLKFIFLLISTLFITVSLILDLFYILDLKKIILTYILIIISTLITLLLLLNKYKSKTNEVIDYIVFILNALIFVLILTNLLILPSKVSGTSMMETYSDGDRVFVNLYNPSYKVNDVVVYNTNKDNPNSNNSSLIIKRIVALKGDKVSLLLYENQYVLYINDEKYINQYNEEYTIHYSSNSKLFDQLNNLTYTLKEDEVFLLGDNSENSLDSRQTGILSIDNLVGKVIGGK